MPEYKDAHTFFRRTFLTRGLRATLKGVRRRLGGHDDGIAITQMATVFGGGKTHTLLALYHIVRHGTEVVTLAPVQELLAEAGLDALPAARVAAVDCAQISPSQPAVTPEGLTLHTLWGEIAYRLGGPEFYEIVRQSDQDRACKGLLGAVWGCIPSPSPPLAKPKRRMKVEGRRLNKLIIRHSPRYAAIPSGFARSTASPATGPASIPWPAGSASG